MLKMQILFRALVKCSEYAIEINSTRRFYRLSILIERIATFQIKIK